MIEVPLQTTPRSIEFQPGPDVDFRPFRVIIPEVIPTLMKEADLLEQVQDTARENCGAERCIGGVRFKTERFVNMPGKREIKESLY